MHIASVYDPSYTIWYDDVECNGTEWRLNDCYISELDVNNCTHSDDASVRCNAPIDSGTFTLHICIQYIFVLCTQNQKILKQHTT